LQLIFPRKNFNEGGFAMTRYGSWMVMGVVLLAGMLLAQPASQGPAATPLTGGETALRALVDDMIAAINRQDVEGFVKHLAEAAEVTVGLGGFPETFAGREQMRQALQMNPPWGMGEFTIKLPPNQVKWGIIGREAVGIADFEIHFGGQAMRPRFVIHAQQGQDRTWSVTKMTEADNLPRDEQPPPAAGQAGVYLVVGFDLAPGKTEDDLSQMGQENLETWLQQRGVVSLRFCKTLPFPIPGFEPLSGYMVWIGLRSMEDLEALGANPEMQAIQAKTEEIAENIRLSIYTVDEVIAEGRALTVEQ
jgi:hypothetical protein